MAAAERNEAPLGARLQGVQHFGLTVQNMDRAYEFYTEVLGGTEVIRDGDFQGERIHNTLLTDQEIEARDAAVNPRTIGVPDLAGGEQRLDVRFMQFDNVVIELLQYRDADQPMGSRPQLRRTARPYEPGLSAHRCTSASTFATTSTSTSSSMTSRPIGPPRHDAGEGQPRDHGWRSKRSGWPHPRRPTPTAITEGQSNGWALIYCKGPEGEQLEFVQALGPVKQRFSEALTKRQQIIR